ncbi:hypothetical protein Cgig2_030873 [Carnegiea gigantea]|uniref:Uncharacterized protein n=1 Tax=Carnegiea gigantea TaxID=171969 RepID=A0A9Q1KGH3_9CARY|nr:hypothetical protein Cgig2_030873 [Carnegiea gigantea]
MDKNLAANFYLVTLQDFLAYCLLESKTVLWVVFLKVYSLHSEDKYLTTGIFCINEAIESPWSEGWLRWYFAFGINSLVFCNSNPYLRLIRVSSACVMVSASVRLVRPFYKNGRRCGGIFCRHIGVQTSDAIFTFRQIKEPIIQSLMPHKSPVVRKDRIVYLETQLVFPNFPRAFLMCIVVARVANLLQCAPSSTSKWTTFPSHQWRVLGDTNEEASDTTVSCQKKLLVVFKKVIDSYCWESRIFFKHDLQPYDLLSALKQVRVPANVADVMRYSADTVEFRP